MPALIFKCSLCDPSGREGSMGWAEIEAAGPLEAASDYAISWDLVNGHVYAKGHGTWFVETRTVVTADAARVE